jgi:hypothetical protein
MNELTIFEVDPELQDPYSGVTQMQYISPYEVYDRLREMHDAEKSTLYDLLPDELAELMESDTEMNEDVNMSRLFYYHDRAAGLMETFGDDDLPMMELALYQADGGLNTGYDTSEVLLTITSNEDLQKVVGLKSLVCKYIFRCEIDKNKKYKQFAKFFEQELHDFPSKLEFISVFEIVFRIMKDDMNWGKDMGDGSWAMVVRYDVNSFYDALKDKINALDLGKYLTAFVQARELCLSFDRFIRELGVTAQLNRDLKLFYEKKEAALLAQYNEKVAALEAKYGTLEITNNTTKEVSCGNIDV